MDDRDNQKKNADTANTEGKEESGEKKPVPEYAYGKYSNYQRQQTNRYNKENYKTITVRFRDNGQREMIQAAAKMVGTSLNAFCEELLVREAYNILMKIGKTAAENDEREENGEKTEPGAPIK